MKKIPDNITCLMFDDILESGQDENTLQYFRCGNCLIEFATHGDVLFPKFCPNCGEQFEWKDKQK